MSYKDRTASKKWLIRAAIATPIPALASSTTELTDQPRRCRLQDIKE